MEDVLTQLTRQFLPQMTAAEKSRALRSLKALIDAELFDLAASEGAEDDPDRACPRCGSPHYVKRGRDGRGRQRFLCRGCARTFTDATMRIFSTTKLDRSAWMRFAECHVDMLLLRESAEKCGVCLKTAFFMRHRLLEAMAKRMPAFRVEAGGGAELDECFFRESFKGNRSRSESGVPRKPRARSQGTDGHEKICVLTGINDAGDIFYEIAGRGGLDEAAARELLADKLAVGAIISTDRAHVYRRVLPALGVGEHIASKREEHAINRVNSLHSQMRHFIGRFRGVSTRRLENYLAWFKWTWCFKVRRSADELAELIVRQAARGTYEKTWRQYKVTPYPFYEYWIKQAKWDSRARRAIYGVA
ncbi:MAG: IS1595 family transposase [Collinsella sp.]|nr:IS1595 family transposase [Collinsella sp.]